MRDAEALVVLSDPRPLVYSNGLEKEVFLVGRNLGVIIQMWQNHRGMQGKREEREEGNEKRRKKSLHCCFIKKKNPITSKLLIYPSEIFYIEAFKYRSQYYIRKYFIYINSTFTKLDCRSPESHVKSYCINKHWEIKIPLCSWIWNKIYEESLQFDDSNFKNFNLRFIDSLVTMVILRLLFISVMTPREQFKGAWSHVIE